MVFMLLNDYTDKKHINRDMWRIYSGIQQRIPELHTKSAVEMMPDANLELPYEGAKEMLLVDDVEDKEFLRELIETMYNELPAPKKKK